MTKNLSRLLRPRSIAVFGGGWSVAVIEQCRKMGFAGGIWPVHPAKSELGGVPCFASVADLPAAPDASFIGVNRHATVDIVADLARRGAGGAVCFASGFREVADGQGLQDSLVNAAGDMPILGPNCYGFVNYVDGALLWPDQHGGQQVHRGAAIIAQSSNVAINMTMQNRGLPLAYVLTVGNQAQTGMAEMIETLVDDPRVTSIGLYIEGFDDVPAMERALNRAHEMQIPVVTLKVGKSDAAQAMTMSHTASLAGSDELITAFLARQNVARVTSVDELLETLKILHVHGPLPSATIGSLSCSGGEASIMGDLAQAAGLNLRPLTDAEADKVGATLPEMVTISNPLDYHTFTWGDEASLTKTYGAMLACDFGLTCLICDVPRPDRCVDNGSEAALRAAIAAKNRVGGRLAVVSLIAENLTEELAARLTAEGIVPLNGLQTAVKAIAYAAQIGAGRARSSPETLVMGRANQVDDAVVTLTEWDSKAILRARGVSTPRSSLVHSSEDAVQAADTIGYPVVLKAVSSQLAHKTEMGAVVLNLKTPDEVGAAALRLGKLNVPLLVEQMVADPVAELIVGVSRDAQFGLYLTIGAGGVMVELLKDACVLLLPVTRHEVRTALMSLKTAALLTGFRNAPAVDLEAVIDVAMGAAQYAMEKIDSLEELDINPLIATASGAYAADALIRTREF